MAPRVGLEPTAYRLTAKCSTIELPWNNSVILHYCASLVNKILRHSHLKNVFQKFLERMTRIELALSAWEADVLPLNYIRTPV